MAIADRSGVPISIGIESASPHETKLARKAVDDCFVADAPELLIGDRAYDSDPLDAELRTECGVELISPHREGRKKPSTQDGRPLRRYRRRWKIERLFAWLFNFRRLVVRYERYEQNYLGMLRLGCLVILLRYL